MAGAPPSTVFDFIENESALERLGLVGDENEDEEAGGNNEDARSKAAPPKAPPPKWAPAEFWGALTAGHKRAITALAVHPKGGRIATGAVDQTFCLWDLSSQALHPFRQIAPAEGYTVRELNWSCSGGHLAIASGDSVVNIVNADGGQAAQTYRGVPQVLDTAKTEGHNHSALSVDWSPFERSKFCTGSLDGTVRLWDLTSRPKGIDEALPHVQCFKTSGASNGRVRTGVTVVRYLPTCCRSVLGAATDGSVCVWDFERRYDRPQTVIRKAHVGELTGMTVARDDQRFFTRGQDETMKAWDLRQIKAPVHIWRDLPNTAAGVGVCLSPDETLLLTAVASGGVAVFDPLTGEAVQTLDVGGSAQAVVFPKSLQQIVVGDKSGAVRFYGGEFSRQTVKPMCWRDARKRTAGAAEEAASVPVYTMENLPTGIRATKDGEIRMLRGYRLRQERQDREPRTTQQMPHVNKRGRKETWRREDDDFLSRY